MTERKYLPTIADLIDRMSITLMKSIFIDRAYREEIELIRHDLGVALENSEVIYPVMVLMLANRVIWENESRVRENGSDEDHRLRLTHSINGVRNRAKNEIAKIFGERVDQKIDCLAADLPKEFGSWRVFDD